MLFPSFTPRLSDLIAKLPLFDGFPYISTRLVPVAYHILLLPNTWPPARLLNALERQVAVNEFEAALVLSPKDAVFLAPGGEPAHSKDVPRSSVVLSGKLYPAAQFDPDVLGSRPEQLAAFVQAMNPDRYIHGDWMKGGRRATRRDRRLFGGRKPDGTPRGLERCPQCHEWHGWCLDQIPDHPECLVPVHCLCQNTTFCARCLEPFHQRRVGGNRYDERDGRVWHSPGFLALSHQCLTTD